MSPAVPAPRFSGVVAIDGPSGAGKSTVAKLLAARLGARYLDTGAMYRAITLATLRAGIRPDDEQAVAALAARERVTVSTNADKPSVSIDGLPVDGEIRSARVTATVSAVSAVAAVREVLVRLQRELIAAGSIVVEGRDIGTVVAPDAALKVFLTASADARAGRRGSELGASDAGAVAATAADLARRDRLDSNRTISPLQPAADAVVLDTTQLRVEEVVSRIYALAIATMTDPASP
ncbi:MAG: (d)CMP kinase [Mycobacteriales bacterium]